MSTEQERAEAHMLTNDFQAVRLYSLRTWPDAAWYAPPETSGPYIVLQTAIDPETPGVDIDEFILKRDGHWLPLAVFFQSDWDYRNASCFFPTAADAILVMQTLTGRPVIDRSIQVTTPPGDAEGRPSPDQDAFRRALESRE